jgi:predicted phage tail protein
VKTLCLHGQLRKVYGYEFRLDVAGPAEAVRALASQLHGFRERIEAGRWLIVRGDLRHGERIDAERARLVFPRDEVFHLVPAYGGAKRGGVGKIILGTVLIATSFLLMKPAGPALMGAAAEGAAAGAAGAGAIPAALATTGWNTSVLFGLTTAGGLARAGLGLVLSGVASLLAPQQRRRNDPVAGNPSFLFAGPVNVGTEGVPVPLAYGRCLAGSVVIASSLRTEDHVAGKDFPHPPAPFGAVLHLVIGRRPPP